MSKVAEKTMEELLAATDLSFRSLRRGDVVEGKVISISEKEILIDLGTKAEGILLQREIKGLDLKLGDKLLVYVLTLEDRGGQILLSLKKAESANAWLKLEDAAEKQKSLSAEVTGYNKGGLIVVLLGTQAFIPFSHLVTGPEPSLAKPELQSALDKMRGNKISVKVIELDREKDRVILSEREAVEEIKSDKRAKKLAKFKIDQKIKGVIKSVMPYGLVITVDGSDVRRNGVEGLIPQDELSWEEKTGQLASFEIGQEVFAKVLSINQESDRITLSIKRLSVDPWEELTMKFKPKKKVKGEITRITSFGVFVRITNGIEGLLPLSSLPKEKSNIEIGGKLDVVIKAVDKENRRLELGV